MYRIRQRMEQIRHFLRRFEMAFGIVEQAEAGVVQGAVFADAGQHVLQWPPRRDVVMDVVGRDQRHPGRQRQPGQPVQPPGVVAAIQATCREPGIAGKKPGYPFENKGKISIGRRRVRRAVLRDGHPSRRAFRDGPSGLLNALLRMKGCVRYAIYSFILRRG